jgi:hypothetical protein
MDRVHGLRLTSLQAKLNAGHWLPDRWLGLNQANRYSLIKSPPQILERTARSDFGGGRCSGRWRNRPVVAAHQSWPYTVLRTSVFDEVFTHGIGVTWRTYFAHLGRTAGNNGG